MDVTELLSQGWEYRGEGNANVAIALPKIRKILRISKTEKPNTILGWLIEWLKEILKWDYTKQIEYEKRNLDFYNHVMVPFFGQIYAQPAIAIKTYPSVMKKLGREIMTFRPKHRSHKILQNWIASLLTDYTVLPKQLDIDDFEGATLSVEIKPKQGWIPVNERHSKKCLFCSNQFLKFRRGQIKEISFYCPLDLFSGEKTRILKALKALVLTPQNNLKVFKNGSYYYGEDVSKERLNQLLCEFFGRALTCNDRLLDRFCFLLHQSVLRNFETDATFTKFDFVDESIPEPFRDDKCTFSQFVLPDGCILKKILNMQKLNQLGLNKYKEMYNELKEGHVEIDKWSYVDQFFHQDTQRARLCDNFTSSNMNLVPYLLAAVAYDCSFMITLRKLNNASQIVNKRHLITDGSNNFLVNIGVFDLYPKPLHTIAKHVKRHDDILNATLVTSRRLFS